MTYNVFGATLNPTLPLTIVDVERASSRALVLLSWTFQAIMVALFIQLNANMYSQLHRVLKKGATKLMVVTSSNLNRFPKFFYHWKESEISNKTPCIISNHTLSMLPHYLAEFKSSNLSQILKKMQTKNAT